MGWGTTLIINAARTENNPMIHNTAAKPAKFVCLKKSISQSFRIWVYGYHYWEKFRIYFNVIKLKVGVSLEACLPIRIETKPPKKKNINLQILPTKWNERNLTLVFKASGGWTSDCTQCSSCRKLESKLKDDENKIIQAKFLHPRSLCFL